jgi:hypothetical protein
MHLRFMAVLVLAASSLAGCSDTPAAITDPSKLAPLTDEDKQKIQQEDTRVQNEEQKTPFKATGKGSSSKASRSKD